MNLKKIKKLFILVLFSGFFYSCANDKNEMAIVSKKVHFPVETATDIEVLYSDSAKVKAALKAPLMNKFVSPSSYVEMPKGVDLKFFDDSLNVISTLASNYAISRDDENIMEARNNVVVVNQKNEKLNTEHLIWDKKTKKIYSDVFAKITTQNEIIYGNGFEANEDFSKYKINHVKGIINVNKAGHAPDS